MRPHTSTRAFTLIEMMIVIGIIGLLISISMTALISVRKQGYKVGEKNNIRQLGNAWLKYSQIHREKIARMAVAKHAVQMGNRARLPRWHHDLPAAHLRLGSTQRGRSVDMATASVHGE